MKQTLEKASIYGLIATCASLPLPTPLLSFFSILTIALWVLSGQFKRLPSLISSDIVAFCSLLLFFMFLAGIFYSSADLSEGLSTLKKYRELFLLVVVLSLVRGRAGVQKKCELAFLFGCIILMLFSFGVHFALFPEAKFGNSYLFHITHNFFMSLLAYFSLSKALEITGKGWKIFWGVIFLSSVLNIFYLAPGRTGMLIFLCLMLLLFMQRLSLLKQLTAFIIFGLLVGATYLTSENFSGRTQEAIKEIQTYQQGKSRTSLGQRLDWYSGCVAMIKKQPLFGYGTGSFSLEHDAHIEGTKIKRTDNPHNEYLFIAVQLGLTGLFLFLFLMTAQFFFSFGLPQPDRYLLQGVVVSMVIGCMINSFLYDTHQGHTWALLSAIYLAQLPRCSFLPGVKQ